jgi:hypothetical protein
MTHKSFKLRILTLDFAKGTLSEGLDNLVATNSALSLKTKRRHNIWISAIAFGHD